MPHYIYDGTVMAFEDILDRNWHGETFAPTEGRAKSNLSYKYKIDHNLAKDSKVTLPDNLVVK